MMNLNHIPDLIDPVTDCIPRPKLEEIMGKRQLDEFDNFMEGQTITGVEGVTHYFPYDVSRFLRGLPVLD